MTGGSSAAAPWIGVDGHAAEIYVSELRTLPRHHRFKILWKFFLVVC
ncbi:unnamed protein product [Rhodiola kirilowii]